LDDERKQQKESIKDQADRLKVLKGGAKKVGSIKHAESNDEDTSELEQERDTIAAEIQPTEDRIDELIELLKPYKAIKKELSDAKKLVKQKRENLLKRLEAKIEEMSDDELATLVLDMLRADFIEMLDDYVSALRRSLIALGENLWDKYSTDLNSIEDDRDASAKLLREFTEELSYV
jgi:DNA repair exonuclease SbcCD ATPase subunit